MEDLQAALQSILSDPEQLARVAALAESLGLKPPDGEQATGNRQQATGDGGEATGNRQQATGDGGRGDPPFVGAGSPGPHPPVGAGSPGPHPSVGAGSPSPHPSVGAGAFGDPPPVGAGSPGPGGTASPAFSLPGLDLPELGRLLGLLSAASGGEARVLNALRPALDPAGQARVDRALRAAKLSRLAGSLLKQGRAERV